MEEEHQKRLISGLVQVTRILGIGLIEGFRVIAIDLPAHGRSGGQYISSTIPPTYTIVTHW